MFSLLRSIASALGHFLVRNSLFAFYFSKYVYNQDVILIPRPKRKTNLVLLQFECYNANQILMTFTMPLPIVLGESYQSSFL